MDGFRVGHILGHYVDYIRKNKSIKGISVLVITSTLIDNIEGRDR